ncbi:hypothetical protein [Trichothermofontia sp.]
MSPASFLQHCQGAIAGAWQAECYSHWYLNQAPKHLWLTQWSPLPWQAQPPGTLTWTIADRCAQDLIAHGQVFPDRWLADLLQRNDFGASTNPTGAIPTAADILVALLPVAVFYHDDPTRLAQASQVIFLALRRAWPEARMGIAGQEIGTELDWSHLAAAWLGFALALSQICQGNREPMTLIPQVLATFPAIAAPVIAGPQAITQVEECWQSVQRGLTQGAGLATVVPTLLGPGPARTITQSVALALYCFLSAPQDFRWAVVRSLRTTQLQPPISPGDAPRMSAPSPGFVALTGALAGGYHGPARLPRTLPGLTEQPSTSPHRLSPPSGPAVLSQMLPLAAAWAGAYDPHELSALPVVALPRSVCPSS